MDNNNNRKPANYREMVEPMLEKSEGFKDSLYYDSNDNPTIGHGINLKDDANREMLNLQGVDVDSLYNGGRLTPEQSSNIKNQILDRKEGELKSLINPDMFDQLDENQKAGLMSLMYNSGKLIGPNLRQNLANKDHLGVAREILSNSNPKNELGTLVRRSDEANQYLGNNPEQLQNLFKLLSDDEKARIKSILDKTDNEPVKKEYMEKYGQYLTPPRQTLKNFNKLFYK